MALISALTSLADEAAADFDRLCSALGSSSLSRVQFIDVLRGCDLLPTKPTSDISMRARRENTTEGHKLFDCLFDMCVEAEAIAAQQTSSSPSNTKNSSRFVPSKALEVGNIDGDALRCLYANHPTYVKCRNPMDTALALTNYIKDLFESSIVPNDSNDAIIVQNRTRTWCETRFVTSSEKTSVASGSENFESKEQSVETTHQQEEK